MKHSCVVCTVYYIEEVTAWQVLNTLELKNLSQMIFINSTGDMPAKMSVTFDSRRRQATAIVMLGVIGAEFGQEIEPSRRRVQDTKKTKLKSQEGFSLSNYSLSRHTSEFSGLPPRTCVSVLFWLLSEWLMYTCTHVCTYTDFYIFTVYRADCWSVVFSKCSSFLHPVCVCFTLCVCVYMYLKFFKPGFGNL